jgi:hypothetical protein
MYLYRLINIMYFKVTAAAAAVDDCHLQPQ